MITTYYPAFIFNDGPMAIYPHEMSRATRAEAERVCARLAANPGVPIDHFFPLQYCKPSYMSAQWYALDEDGTTWERVDTPFLWGDRSLLAGRVE